MMTERVRLTGVRIGAAVVLWFGVAFGVLVAGAGSLGADLSEAFGVDPTLMEQALRLSSYLALGLCIANVVVSVQVFLGSPRARALGTVVCGAWFLIAVLFLVNGGYPGAVILGVTYGFVLWALRRNAEPVGVASDTPAEPDADPRG